MIARVWHGETTEQDAEYYGQYVGKTGAVDLAGTEGNMGCYVLRRLEGGACHFTVLSFWESFDAIRRFAGPDVDTARYYPEDKKYLKELAPKVEHHEVVSSPRPSPMVTTG